MIPQPGVMSLRCSSEAFRSAFSKSTSSTLRAALSSFLKSPAYVIAQVYLKQSFELQLDICTESHTQLTKIYIAWDSKTWIVYTSPNRRARSSNQHDVGHAKSKPAFPSTKVWVTCFWRMAYASWHPSSQNTSFDWRTMGLHRYGTWSDFRQPHA